MAILNKMQLILGKEVFTWPHNPTTCQIGYEKKIIKHEYPGVDGVETEDDGLGARIISGSGSFFGKNAYSDFKLLESYYKKKNIGTLIHPTWGSISVNFIKLNVKQEPTPNYVEYDYEFIEHKDLSVITVYKPPAPSNNNSSSNTSGAKTYTVKKGDTLWAISKVYYGHGKYWPKIANANKSLIKDPDLIYPGWKLTIPK